MKKQLKLAAVAAALLTVTPLATTTIAPTNVMAETKAVKRTFTHNAYIYNKNGKKLANMYYKKGITVKTYGSAVKIKDAYYYYVGNGKYVKRANFQPKFKANTLTLPTGYGEARDQYNDLQTNGSENKLIKLSRQGVKDNVFHAESKADDHEKATAPTLTATQIKELNKYALNLLNSARKQAGVSKIKTDKNIQNKFTDQNDWDQAKYTFRVNNYPKTMTGMKKVIYNSLKKMLFNGAYSDYHSYDRANMLLKGSNTRAGIWFSGNSKTAVLNWGVADLPSE